MPPQTTCIANIKSDEEKRMHGKKNTRFPLYCHFLWLIFIFSTIICYATIISCPPPSLNPTMPLWTPCCQYKKKRGWMSAGKEKYSFPFLWPFPVANFYILHLFARWLSMTLWISCTPSPNPTTSPWNPHVQHKNRWGNVNAGWVKYLSPFFTPVFCY